MHIFTRKLDILLPPSPYPAALAASVCLLILSEAHNIYVGSAGFKVAASLSFLGAGIQKYRTITRDQSSIKPSGCMVLGLVFSVVGDILLIPSAEDYFKPSSDKATGKEGESPRFKAGTLSFALAHIAYTASFLYDSTSAGAFRKTDFLVALTSGALLTYWLGIIQKTPPKDAWFNVPKGMRGLVTTYVSIIMVMVATATATDRGLQRTIGAWTFMISDLFVAADVFGVRKQEDGQRGKSRQGWRRRAVGWVAYFGAQLLLAACI
ncbi:hypothetical protein D9613_007708 [Agrocybe pediades]|uniref:YhhN-like protein n=1 Tax=Agrocybe pediades TaxID=84607 RepID=A0A8H4VL18_9AGAR|nr:hypothetical protein D9613_007708 [Agrocybe pediades]